MDQKTNISQSEDSMKELSGKENYYIGRNQEEQDKGTRSV